MQLTTDDIIAIIGGLIGASVYVFKQKSLATLLEKLFTVSVGAAMSWLCTPLISWKLGLDDVPGAVGFIGASVGAFFMEMFELVTAVLDEIQKNPKFIIHFIKKKLMIDEKEEVQKGKRDEDEGKED